MDTLIKKQKALKLKAIAVKVTVDQHVNTPLDEASVSECLEDVIKYQTEGDSLNDSIIPYCNSDADIISCQTTYEDIKNMLYKVKINLVNIGKTFASSTPSAPVASSSSGDVRLPKLELPTFSGNIQQWLSFHDLFVASVHNSNKLSGAQKLQYLKASVKGEAANLIQLIEVTNDNYDKAWTILNNRYSNKREIIKTVLERFITQPFLQQESAEALRKFVDTSNECITSLEVLKIPIEAWGDQLIIHIMSKKLDHESRLQWERTLKDDTLPTYKEFHTFLDHHARVITAAKGVQKSKCSNLANNTTTMKKSTVCNYGSSKSSSCIICTGDHQIYKCEQFLKNTVPDRINLAKKHNLCFNCLYGGHSVSNCKSKYKCKTCQESHNSLLHLTKEKKEEPTVPEQQPSVQSTVSTLFSSEKQFKTQVLLSTALIKVKDAYGKDHVLRALIDNGSQSSIVTEKCVQKLKLQKRNTSVPITGIGAIGAGQAVSIVNIQFSSCIKSFSLITDALILPKVTSTLPNGPIDYSSWTHINSLKLADPSFSTPGQVDILLGNDVYPDLLIGNKISGPQGTPTAIETQLGWILAGKIENHTTTAVNVCQVNCNVDSILQRFWELEEVPRKKFLTEEDKQCEEIFDQTYSRDSNGKYTVKLPFKTTSKPIGESRENAVRRLKQVERRLASKPEQKELYKSVIQEYLDLGHMEPIQPNEIVEENKIYYMPHHGVIKESSTTTRLRVVFDASSASTNGVSLNDNLLVGPRLQEDLINILIRFRVHKIVFTADIAKMYRQFLVHRDDVNFQRIVWRTSPEEPIKDYRLLTATFGTASAPYLAIKCIQQLAKDEAKDFPEAAAILQRDLYVDDLMSGADNEQEALKIQEDLLSIMKRGKLELRKWSSNCPALLQTLPSDMRETNLPLTIDQDEAVKTLGLQWHPGSDSFKFTVSTPEISKTPSKRIVASENAKIFDPLGWLSPVTIKSKILLQQLWKSNIEWDEDLPEDLLNMWLEYRQELKDIENIRIQRCVTNVKCDVASDGLVYPEDSLPSESKSHAPTISYQLHGYSDASEQAYAAVVYLHTIIPGSERSINLVAAKTRVAPLKTQTLPRLELCGAVVLSNLVEAVKDSLSLPISEVHSYTDSEIVLAWLASCPQRWKTFTANRVSEIQQTLPYKNWHHVKSENNPADCASRGISPQALKNHSLWWNCPYYTESNSSETRVFTTEVLAEAAKEERKQIVIHHISLDLSLLNKYSSWNKLVRMTAYLLRFKNNSKLKNKAERKLGLLSVQELNAAQTSLIKFVQLEVFQQEVTLLKKSKSIPNNSKILQFNPFLDKDGLLRVGGRLKNSQLTADRKFPILLPKKHRLTELIVESYHRINLHAGPQLLLNLLQQRFWIISGRDVVRQFCRKCVICFRQKAEISKQMMGDLPTPRVNPGRPFLKCGVDYAGPFTMRLVKGRETRRQPMKTYKAYLALFVCFVTRAVHLELVSDMTSEAFIAALKRFIARRGKCSDIYSDCGSNFVGANKELQQFMKTIKTEPFNNSVQTHLANEGIRWHFNPPGAPHFGGLWEAGVKSVKYHLRRIVGNHTLNFEDMTTVLTQIEACLNSRPLTAMSSNADDLSALTPAHFLIGDVLTAVPEPDLTTTTRNRLSRWEQSQQLVQHFWRRWSSEFLSRLQQRPKWYSQQKNIVKGELVLIKEDDLPPLKWKLGRVLETFPGKDDKVRVIRIKTAEGELTRPIVKVVKLPIDQDV